MRGVISGKRDGTFFHSCIKFDELNGIERDVTSGKREEMGYPFIKSMLSSLKKELEVFQLEKLEVLKLIFALRGVSSKGNRRELYFILAINSMNFR